VFVFRLIQTWALLYYPLTRNIAHFLCSPIHIGYSQRSESKLSLFWQSGVAFFLCLHAETCLLTHPLTSWSTSGGSRRIRQRWRWLGPSLVTAKKWHRWDALQYCVSCCPLYGPWIVLLVGKIVLCNLIKLYSTREGVHSDYTIVIIVEHWHFCIVIVLRLISLVDYGVLSGYLHWLKWLLCALWVPTLVEIIIVHSVAYAGWNVRCVLSACYAGWNYYYYCALWCLRWLKWSLCTL